MDPGALDSDDWVHPAAFALLRYNAYCVDSESADPKYADYEALQTIATLDAARRGQLGLQSGLSSGFAVSLLHHAGHDVPNLYRLITNTQDRFDGYDVCSALRWANAGVDERAVVAVDAAGLGLPFVDRWLTTHTGPDLWLVVNAAPRNDHVRTREFLLTCLRDGLPDREALRTLGALNP